MIILVIGDSSKLLKECSEIAPIKYRRPGTCTKFLGTIIKNVLGAVFGTAKKSDTPIMIKDIVLGFKEVKVSWYLLCSIHKNLHLLIRQEFGLIFSNYF